MKASRRATVLAPVRRQAADSVQAPAGNKVPTQEMIAQRAYQKWLAGGCPNNTDVQDWLEAEAELKAELNRHR